LPAEYIIAALRHDLVIPAHPLALNGNRKLDEKHQRALTRYYCAASAAGIAGGTLNSNEDLSAGQMEKIDRVYAAHLPLTDDTFVAENLAEWFK
jgi:hypothetical protein